MHDHPWGKKHPYPQSNVPPQLERAWQAMLGLGPDYLEALCGGHLAHQAEGERRVRTVHLRVEQEAHRLLVPDRLGQRPGEPTVG